MRRARPRASVAIELGGCGVASVPEPRGRKPVGTAGVLSRAEFFTAQPLAHQKTIGRDAQTRVMMEAAPIAPPGSLAPGRCVFSGIPEYAGRGVVETPICRQRLGLCLLFR